MKLINKAGLSIDFLDNGSVRLIEADPIRISLKAATDFDRSGANIFLRKRSGALIFHPLTGPGSDSRFHMTGEAFFAKGSWEGLDYSLVLQLSEATRSWQWSVEVTNHAAEPVEIDLVYVQDVGLKTVSTGLVNEYYVSQYLERQILDDQNYGAVLCCRQNMRESTGNPWLMIASANTALAGSTDGMQLYGKTYRDTGLPEGLLTATLGGNYAGESPVIALQERPFLLRPGHGHQSIFVATCLPDHPAATSLEDLARLPGLFSEFGIQRPILETSHFRKPETNAFHSSPFLPVDDLTSEEIALYFGEDKRHCEEEDGQLLSFFYGHSNHVMLRAKEIRTDRPHAHIMQANNGLIPDEGIVSTTAFAFGVFNSHLSQGNTNFNVFLSICTSQFNTTPESGQRIFILTGGRRYLLGVPSAFEAGLNFCRWIYRSGDQCFQVRTWTSPDAPRVNLDFKVLQGPTVGLLISHDFDALNSWQMIPGNDPFEFIARPASDSMIAEKFPDARFRILVNSKSADYQACGDEVLYLDRNRTVGSAFVLKVSPVEGFCMSFMAEVRQKVTGAIISSADHQWQLDTEKGQSKWHETSLRLSLGGDNEDIQAIREILPWYAMNALTHFLTPYGLEQFSGAAWGTRDVSQGPVDLLLTLEKYEEAKQVLLIIFSNQNPDGGWPQWWMFDSYSHIRANDSHGDVFYWVILALANYIKVTGDYSILQEKVPYFLDRNDDDSGKTTVSEHIDRLIRMIVDSFIPGTALVPFGGGDWNDSLQPVSKDLAERMISSWTVEMNYQAFLAYQTIFRMNGEESSAKELWDICERIKSDFNKFLVKSGTVSGYGLVGKDGQVSVLLHPEDRNTGVQYSLLPMERGILSRMFTKEQADRHGKLIEKHLKGPDGARLMDRPLKYKGGIQSVFQRAESSTFFGREIGLMYVHEHIRYAESLAITGQAEEFLKALLQAVPVGYRKIVPMGDIRQSNCYYSSSDIIFTTRYEADLLYDEVKSGKLTFRGGWRVYSSGPGIFYSLIITRLLGLRIAFGKVIIDPVMPKSMDGLSAALIFLGYPVTFRYTVKGEGFSPDSIVINGEPVRITCEENPYRRGGAVLPIDLFKSLLGRHENEVAIQL